MRRRWEGSGRERVDQESHRCEARRGRAQANGAAGRGGMGKRGEESGGEMVDLASRRWEGRSGLAGERGDR